MNELKYYYYYFSYKYIIYIVYIYKCLLRNRIYYVYYIKYLVWGGWGDFILSMCGMRETNYLPSLCLLCFISHRWSNCNLQKEYTHIYINNIIMMWHWFTDSWQKLFQLYRDKREVLCCIFIKSLFTKLFNFCIYRVKNRMLILIIKFNNLEKLFDNNILLFYL